MRAETEKSQYFLKLGRIMEPVVSYFAPPLCLHCREKPRTDAYLCDTCRQQAFPEKWIPVHPEDSVCCLHRLNPVVRSLVHGLKYHGMQGIAAYLVSQVRLQMDFGVNPCWIPVPVHSARLRERGYNQALLLAQALQIRWGGTVYPRVLRRKRYAVSQTRLDAQIRRRNIAGAFSAKAPLPTDVILVDDVYTTGSTTGSCENALLRAGARSVRICTIAYEPPGDGREDWLLDQAQGWG
ncbi:MAG TPA: hypothetical protein VLM37_04465 [Fibrobacteraceae bacterium]|nr:hypothetical protein [Fibrobacteraceae bacterium]